MPLSYRNLMSGNNIIDSIKSLKDNKTNINPKFIKGYENESFWENIFKKQLKNSETGRFGELFGFENRELDSNFPFSTDKIEEIWNEPGRILYTKFDSDVDLFRNIMFPDYIGQNTNNKQNTKNLIGEEQYEDPLILGFEISFNTNSPLFYGTDIEESTAYNSIGYFLNKYSDINDIEWRKDVWIEFKNRIFSIFNKSDTNDNKKYSKSYYINKISGLENLIKKITNYGEDKLTITLNEDVRMISWYISELYNTLSYSYKNKRWMIPENLLRFDMNIKIHDIRNFIMPFRSENKIEYEISKKSTIMFTLHDCSFIFNESKNFDNDIIQSGYDQQIPGYSSLDFNIIYKSVTRWTDLPLLNKNIDPWGKRNIEYDNFKNLQRAKFEDDKNNKNKGFWNDKLKSTVQTVSNASLNYLDNLETRLREERGKFVEKTLNEFKNKIPINKIEPDNVYNKDFNNRISLRNAAKSLASDLLNDFGDDIRNITNF